MQITRIHEDPQAAVDPLLSEYLDAKAAFDLAKARLDVAASELLNSMEDKHQKSYRWTNGDRQRSVTYVRSDRAEIDEKGLRKALTAKVFDKYTVKKLDRKAMEAAMDTGEVDPMIVSKYVTTKPGAPYLKYSERNVEEEL